MSSTTTNSWRCTAAAAPALALAALGSLWTGASTGLSQGYFDADQLPLLLNALCVELDRNMSLAIGAAAVILLPALMLRRAGYTGRTMVAAVWVLTATPVLLSVYLSPEFQTYQIRRPLALHTTWAGVPLPDAVRHYTLILTSMASALAVAAVLTVSSKGKAATAMTGSAWVVASLAIWAAAHVTYSGLSSEPEKPRHVIFLTWDSTRADHISSYGYPHDTTPELDAFAAEGVLFEQAYAQNNWTRPSYASLLTSQLNYRIHDEGRIRDDVTTLTETLKSRGYHTVGIVQNPNLAPRWGFHQGFDEYYRVTHDSTPEAINALALPRIKDLAEHDGPLFLFIHYQEPHWPYANANRDVAPVEAAVLRQLMSENHGEDLGVSEQEVASYLLDSYDADIRATDSGMATLLTCLKELDLYSESLVVFASDHGDEFYEHQAFGHGHDNLHPELTRVPLMIRFPDSMEIGGERIGSIVRNLDVIPTILDVVGIPQPSDMEGVTLLPLERLATEGRVASCNYGPMLMLRSSGLAALYDPRQDPTLRFFDMAKDPTEMSPILLADVGDRGASISAMVAEWLAEYRDIMGTHGGADDGSQIGAHHHADPELIEQLRALGYVK